MIILVSGEGPTDIGVCSDGTSICSGNSFAPGQMLYFIDRIVEPIWQYPPLQTAAFTFISEAELGKHSRSLKQLRLPSRDHPRETAYFFKNARALARIATELCASQKCPVGAVLFRDADGTRSAPSTNWTDKVRSIEDGFEIESFDLGVPMVPKPKQESWILCALQPKPYQNCDRFENLSGNDASPKAPKRLLAHELETRGLEFKDLDDLIASGKIDPLRIKMNSFVLFRARMEEVAKAMLKKCG